MKRQCKHTKATYDPRHKETYCRSCNRKICNSCATLVHDDCTYCFPCCKTHDYMPQVEFEEKATKRNIFEIRREINYRQIIYKNLSTAVFGASLKNLKISDIWEHKLTAKIYKELWKEVRKCD